MEGHAVCNAKEKEMPPDVKQDQKKVTVRTMDFSHKDIEEGTHANRNSKAPQKGCKLQSVPLRQQVKTVKIPRTMKNEAYLKHADLTLGQKRYLCSIAKIYSTGNMRALTEKHLRSQIRCGSKKARLHLPASGKSKKEIMGHCKRVHTAATTTEASRTIEDVRDQITALSIETN
ncbi:protein FAM216A isoform X1 [Ranitomeya imitator]|uniref:protein FAM216A isoform X1 n=1 Tax=Ranitomeya imitator TaxID=111125 RepID=UPI0037E8B9D6